MCFKFRFFFFQIQSEVSEGQGRIEPLQLRPSMREYVYIQSTESGSWSGRLPKNFMSGILTHRGFPDLMWDVEGLR